MGDLLISSNLEWKCGVFSDDFGETEETKNQL